MYGDVNTGGIAGSMAIEYTLDPEDDVTGHLSNIYRKQYEYRSIIQKCVNTGDVAGKRSYVGGIVGRMDLGYLTACETSSCTITNENGSYTGGIAGLTGATVLGNFSKCTLSGKKYVGGIVGSGVQENVDGSGSSVRWNYSLVDITDCQQYQGAISGSDTAHLSITTMSPTISPASTVRATPDGPSPSAILSCSHSATCPRA